MQRFLLLLTLLGVALTYLTNAAPTPIPLDTMTHTPNPANALLARNGTAVTFKNIWLNCNSAIAANGDAEVYFCGKAAQVIDPTYWVKPQMCLNLCKCDCNKDVTCKEWKQCDRNKMKKICVSGAAWSLGCYCDDGTLLQPPAGVKATNTTKGRINGTNVTEHAVSILPLTVQCQSKNEAIKEC